MIFHSLMVDYVKLNVQNIASENNVMINVPLPKKLMKKRRSVMMTNVQPEWSKMVTYVLRVVLLDNSFTTINVMKNVQKKLNGNSVTNVWKNVTTINSLLVKRKSVIPNVLNFLSNMEKNVSSHVQKTLLKSVWQNVLTNVQPKDGNIKEDVNMNVKKEP